ncbi:MAG: MBL fold metallo-hydrolase, partial [Microgenomates group bacterium]
MKIEQVVVGQLSTNCYLVWDEESLETIIIDPGDDGDYIIRRIADFNLSPKYILATHGHFDHILAAAELKLAFNIPFGLHRADLFLLKRASRTAKFFTGSATEAILPPDKFLKEGDKIEFGKESLKVIETPGHTPGGVSFYSPGVLFSGDTIFADGIGRTDFSYGSEEKLKNSIKKLLKLPGKTTVYPGHGDIFDLLAFLCRQG